MEEELLYIRWNIIKDKYSLPLVFRIKRYKILKWLDKKH